MIESLWYGIFASLAFIGFIALVYLLLIHIFRTNDGVVCVYYIDERLTVEGLQNIISRINIINSFTCNCFGEIILVKDNNIQTDLFEKTKSLTDDFGNLILLESDQLVGYLKRKGRHGTGIY